MRSGSAFADIVHFFYPEGIWLCVSRMENSLETIRSLPLFPDALGSIRSQPAEVSSVCVEVSRSRGNTMPADVRFQGVFHQPSSVGQKRPAPGGGLARTLRSGGLGSARIWSVCHQQESACPGPCEHVREEPASSINQKKFSVHWLPTASWLCVYPWEGAGDLSASCAGKRASLQVFSPQTTGFLLFGHDCR